MLSTAMSTAADFTVAPKEELEPWAEEMLAEQEEAQPAQAEEPAQKDPAASDVLLFQVPSLAQGDAQGLADLLLAHPELYEQILQTAAGMLGNDTVARALEIISGPAQEQATTPEPPKTEETTPEPVIEQQAAEETKAGTEEAAVAPAQENAPEAAPVQEAEPEPAQAAPEPEPGWVVRARAYNANHPDEVQLFNHATGYSCIGADGEVDPNAVANWQAANGVAPDGRIGKDTADAAWATMPVEQPAPAALPEEPAEV
jgi:hypothetical protein